MSSPSLLDAKKTWPAMNGSSSFSTQRDEKLPLIDDRAYVAALDECGASRSIDRGRRIHAQLLERRCLGRFLAHHLILMYARCGYVDDARALFDSIHAKNLFSWTLAISAYARNGRHRAALHLFHSLHCEGLRPDAIAFLIAIDSCTRAGDLCEGARIHHRLSRLGFLGPDSRDAAPLGNAIISMYAAARRVIEARAAFEEIAPSRDVISWTAMLAAYARSGHTLEALDLFREMEQEGVRMDPVAALALLDACATLGSSSLRCAEAIHARIRGAGLDAEIEVANAAISMYGSCLASDLAREVFEAIDEARRTPASWNAMIGAYARGGHPLLALEIYGAMPRDAANEITLISALGACAALAALDRGRVIHARAVASGSARSLFVANALLDLYAKCGGLDDAIAVFASMARRDLVSWTSLVSAHARVAHHARALEIFRGLLGEGLKPDAIALAAALDACAGVGDARQGEIILGWIEESQLQRHRLVATAIITMFDRCGRLDRATLAFQGRRSCSSDPSCWNSQMIALAEHGRSGGAIDLFREMSVEGIPANDVSFVSAIFACSHAGLLILGLDLFAQLRDEFGILPQPSHYVCMAELVSRVGEMETAVEVIESMPYEPEAIAWMALLGSNGSRNLRAATMAAHQVFGADAKRSGAYVLLSNLYAVAGGLEDEHGYY